MARAPGWENHPFDFMWFFGRTTKDPQTGQVIPGHVLITEQPIGGQRQWMIPVLAFDRLAREHMESREKRQGQPMKMPNGDVLHAPYRLMDDQADWLVRNGMRFRAMVDTEGKETLVDIPTQEGSVLENMPQSFLHQLVLAHVQRRKQEAPVLLEFGDATKLSLPFELWDAVVKDFIQRRGDIIAAGGWPELVPVERPAKGVPPPVSGYANALGEGVKVDTGQAPPAPRADVAAPGLENAELM